MAENDKTIGHELAPGIWRFGGHVHVSLHDLADQYGVPHDAYTYHLLARRIVERLTPPAVVLDEDLP